MENFTCIDNEIFCSGDIEPYQGLTVPEYIRGIMGDWGDAIAFESGETGVQYTHNDVLNHGRSFGAALLQHGLQKGDVVALVLPNRPEYCSIVFGIWEAGLKACLINPAYTSARHLAKRTMANDLNSLYQLTICLLDELTYYFNLAGVNGVVTELPLLEAVQKAGGIQKLFLLGDELAQGCLSTFKDMIKTPTENIQYAKGNEINTRDETALILFSSGTTGLPKAVQLTHENVVGNCAQIRRPSVFKKLHRFEHGQEQERFIGVLPFFHCFGLQITVFLTMALGAHSLTLSKFQPLLFVQALQRHRPSFIAVVPPITAVLNSDAVTCEDLTSIRMLFTGAAPTPKSHVEKLDAKCQGSFPQLTGFGLTELSPVATICREVKLDSVGVPVPMTRLKVVDLETGESLPSYANGEVCIKGPQVMKGYLNNEEATLETIDKDGWLHTGDLGHYDDEFYLFIVDRLKDMIKVKGFQVSPTELENLIKNHGSVVDAAVVGVPDEEAGELPLAFITVSAGTQEDQKEGLEQEIQEFVKSKVAPFKQLKGGVKILEKIPRNPTGKILRKELLLAYKNKLY